MMTTITKEQATALAALVHELRPDWDTQGVLAAVAKARDKATADVVCIAAIRAATTATNRTPAVIALAGDHWQQPTADLSSTAVVPGPHDTRCTEPGHEHYRLPCRGCRAEALAVDTEAPSPLRLTPEQAALNTQHAHTIRTQLDTARLAAGERPEED